MNMARSVKPFPPLKLILTALALAGCMFLPLSEAFAEPVTVVREYTHHAGDADSKITCRAIALEQVKRLLLEELGTYLVSNTEIVNASLSRDEIVTYTAGAVVTIIIEERWNGEDYYIKAKITADADEVAKSVSAMRDDREKKAELEQLRAKAAESMKEIERLRQELAQAKAAGKPDTGTEVASLRRDYGRAVSALTAKEYVEEGILLRQQGALDEAIVVFGKAIDSAPDWSRPYVTRGAAFILVNDPASARRDLEQALNLNPADMNTVCLRGMALLKLGEKRGALADFRRVTAAAPDDAALSTNIGGTLIKNNMSSEAVYFLSHAISRHPRDNGRAYFLRAQAYSHLGEKQKAVQDLKKAAQHGNRSAREMLNKNRP